ncbi:MAG: hypothetical protein ACRCXB_11985, partial [Aeromonadaceae bacterium]
MEQQGTLVSFLPKDGLDINNGREAQARFQEWLRAQFLAGQPVGELVASRSSFIDQLLIQGWEQFGLHHVPQLALVAVGG